jgi:hypothetical protein
MIKIHSHLIIRWPGCLQSSDSEQYKSKIEGAIDLIYEVVIRLLTFVNDFTMKIKSLGLFK